MFFICIYFCHKTVLLGKVTEVRMKPELDVNNLIPWLDKSQWSVPCFVLNLCGLSGHIVDELDFEPVSWCCNIIIRTYTRNSFHFHLSFPENSPECNPAFVLFASLLLRRERLSASLHVFGYSTTKCWNWRKVFLCLLQVQEGVGRQL